MHADNNKNRKELLPLNLQQFKETITADVINYVKALDQSDDFWLALDDILLKGN